MHSTLLARVLGAAFGCLLLGLSTTAVRSTAAYPATVTPPPGTGTYVIAGDRTKGALLFAAHCERCHGVRGTGSDSAPALKNQKTRQAAVATSYWIKSPQPPMPKLYPATISDRDVADIVAYLESL